jgi:hypothetical protein
MVKRISTSSFFNCCLSYFTAGYVFTRGGYVELSKKLSLPLGRTLDRCVILCKVINLNLL